MKYSEASVAAVLKHIQDLEGSHGIKPAKAYNYLVREIDRFNANSEPDQRIREVRKTTFYGRLKKRVNLTEIFDEGAFRILIRFLEDRGIAVSGSAPADVTRMHAVMSQFAAVSEENDSHLREMLPGYYRTYRPAIGRPGHAVVGLLHIYENSENGALETFEIMSYMPKKPGKGRPRHTYRGMAWYSLGHYLILSTDSNTRFVQTIIMRSLVRDDTEESLEGLYLTVTNKGGSNIACSKIILDRLHCDPDSGKAWIRVLRDTIGYRRPNHPDPKKRISQSIWDRIDPEKPENIIRA